MIAIAQHADGSLQAVCKPITYVWKWNTMLVEVCKGAATLANDLQGTRQAGVRLIYHFVRLDRASLKHVPEYSNASPNRRCRKY
jgi:hypothetical protein